MRLERTREVTRGPAPRPAGSRQTRPSGRRGGDRAKGLRLRGAGVLTGRRDGQDEHAHGRTSLLVVCNHRTVRFHTADWTGAAVTASKCWGPRWVTRCPCLRFRDVGCHGCNWKVPEPYGIRQPHVLNSMSMFVVRLGSSEAALRSVFSCEGSKRLLGRPGGEEARPSAITSTMQPSGAGGGTAHGHSRSRNLTTREGRPPPAESGIRKETEQVPVSSK